MDENNSQCLFVAASLSSRSARALAGGASDLRARSGSSDLDFRWVPPARYHVTLKYIGWTKPELLPAIVDSVASAISEHKPFDMRCREFGAFPSMEKAEVVWAGIDDRMGELAALAKSVGSALEQLGIAEEKSPFVPHVTIARLKPAGNVVKLVQAAPERVFSKSWLESLILYKTSVESDASEYEKLATWSLE